MARDMEMVPDFIEITRAYFENNRLFHHLIFSDCFMKIFVSQKKNDLAMLMRNATTFQYCKSRLASILEFLCIFGNKAQCLCSITCLSD